MDISINLSVIAFAIIATIIVAAGIILKNGKLASYLLQGKSHSIDGMHK